MIGAERPLTFEAWVDEWLAGVTAAHPRTVGGYDERLTAVIRLLPGVRLDRLDSRMLSAAFGEMRARGLSGTSLWHIWRAAHLCLRIAVSRGLIPSNPMDGVPRATKDTMERVPLTRDELRRLFLEAGRVRYGVAVILAGSTGARMGELLALTWRDIDFERGVMTINKSAYEPRRAPMAVGLPKTRASRRALPLSPWVLAALRKHQRDQEADDVRSALVFPNRRGELLRGDVVRDMYYPLLALARCPRITFHDLRHSYATVALTAGGDIHVVSRALGHARVGITVDVYTHAINGASLDQLARQMGALLDPRL